MRKWAIPVMVVFWLLLAVSLSPLQQWAVPPKPTSSGEPGAPVNLFRYPMVMAWAVMLALSQAVLLVRVRADEERPRARRKLWPAVIAAAFCLSLLIGGLVVSSSMGGVGDAALERVDEMGDLVGRILPGVKADDWFPALLFFGFIAGMWAVWWVILGRVLRNSDPETIPAKFFRWILAGSVLELLVAVPCHIIARRRDDCCAPLLTFWGMAMGWALLLLSVGPAVILLFQERMARKTRTVR